MEVCIYINYMFYINCKRVHALHAVASIDAIVAMCAGNMKLSVFT